MGPQSNHSLQRGGERRLPNAHRTVQNSFVWQVRRRCAIEGMGECMKRVLWIVGGVCAAAVGFLVWGAKPALPVEELAHKLEDAWSDHHTIA
jgi:hypothetical protein